MTSFAILLALMAFGPAQTMAKDPGGGGHGGGKSGGEKSGGEKGGDHRVGVGGGAGVNLRVPLNVGGPGGQKTPHQTFDAHTRPEFSGGHGEGRDSWRYRWDNGRWWFWGPDNRWMWYGDDGRWLDYGNAYVVQRPILENFSGGPIRIVNPVKNGLTLNYLLGGNAFTIPPGYSQDLREDRAWVIQFSRGENLDQARYGLQSGVYTFARTDHGWELYRTEFPQLAVPQAPMAAPANPSPQ